ncbi:MAG: peptide chain release factor N(5)-glutamine methyltransferase [Peptococcaceae bacterium]|nr:peptide chain release factor N(5)-glutamine methyltransferase [Peptococcaceae bacterium]
MDKDFFSLNIMELLKAGSFYLESKGIPDSRTEADLLLAFVRGIPRDKLYLELNKEVSPQEKEKYQEFLRRRGEREPLAYLLKTREFMGLEFYVDRNVLIPRPETELLAEKVLDFSKNNLVQKPVRILDLCTGSGALAVAVAFYWEGAEVVGTDISQEALSVAQKNAMQNHVQVDFRLGDLFRPVLGERFHIIVSNPPYVSEEEYGYCSPEVRNEPVLALLGGKDGLDYYRKIALEAEEFLMSEGTLILEIGCCQGQAVKEIFAGRGYQSLIFPDYAGHDRIVMAKKE